MSSKCILSYMLQWVLLVASVIFLSAPMSVIQSDMFSKFKCNSPISSTSWQCQSFNMWPLPKTGGNEVRWTDGWTQLITQIHTLLICTKSSSARSLQPKHEAAPQDATHPFQMTGVVSVVGVVLAEKWSRGLKGKAGGLVSPSCTAPTAVASHATALPLTLLKAGAKVTAKATLRLSSVFLCTKACRPWWPQIPAVRLGLSLPLVRWGSFTFAAVARHQRGHRWFGGWGRGRSVEILVTGGSLRAGAISVPCGGSRSLRGELGVGGWGLARHQARWHLSVWWLRSANKGKVGLWVANSAVVVLVVF